MRRTAALHHGTAPAVSCKARVAAEGEGVDIPPCFDKDLISVALHKLMSKKKAITKAIGASFYVAQRRDVGW